MAFNTSTTARWTILSSSAAIPSGRSRPSALGMYTLRDGLARIGAPLNPRVQIPEAGLQVLPVGVPRLAVHPGGRPRAQRPIRATETIDTDVMQKRGELRVPVLRGNLPHTIQRT